MEQYEKEITAEWNAESTPLYGHVSTTVIISQRSVQQPETKKKEWPYTEEELAV